MTRQLRFSICFLTAVAFATAFQQSAKAQIDFESAIFQNTTVAQNDATGYSVTADVFESGVVAGVLDASVTYGGGNNPFNTGTNWGPGAGTGAGAFRVYAQSTGTAVGDDTADGFWEFSVTPSAGWQVDGISVFTASSTIGNPNFVNLQSNGVGSIFDGNSLISNFTDGATFANGDSLDFNGGSTNNGIPSADHTRQWAINSAGATQMSFTYQVGTDETIDTVGVDALHVDVRMSPISVPEPAAATLLLALSGLFLRRRRS